MHYIIQFKKNSFCPNLPISTLNALILYFRALMKLKRLQVEYEFDFNLFGLISSAKGFKLAWSINQLMSIELVNIDDIELTLRDSSKRRIITYQYETQNSKYTLFHNRTKDLSGVDSGHILPEMNKIDFLLRIDGDIYPSNPGDILQKIRSLNTVEYAMRIDVNKLKTKENLLLF